MSAWNCVCRIIGVGAIFWLSMTKSWDIKKIFLDWRRPFHNSCCENLRSGRECFHRVRPWRLAERHDLQGCVNISQGHQDKYCFGGAAPRTKTIVPSAFSANWTQEQLPVEVSLLMKSWSLRSPLIHIWYIIYHIWFDGLITQDVKSGLWKEQQPGHQQGDSRVWHCSCPGEEGLIFVVIFYLFISLLFYFNFSLACVFLFQKQNISTYTL